jgi:hypothetical protein
MWRLRRKDGKDSGGTAVAERTEGFDGTTDELRTEIDRLSEANRGRPDRATERRRLELRHIAGTRALDEEPGGDYPDPTGAQLPSDGALPEFARADVTPELLRAAILRDGCMLVRGLVERDAALGFAQRIEAVFAERDRQTAGGRPEPGLYEEFEPDPRFGSVESRLWIQEGGGALAADSPTVAFEMLELFRAADLAPLVDGYLGGSALISVHKTTLRKAAPTVPGAWHQDGKFMGPVRSLNLWLSLSRCGDVAPGLDLVPRRLDHLVATGTDEAMLDIQVSQSKAEEAAGDAGIVRPIFEPGDALFFDEMFLHQTASDPSMANPRYAIENWFFASSSFPADYAPIAPW